MLKLESFGCGFLFFLKDEKYIFSSQIRAKTFFFKNKHDFVVLQKGEKTWNTYLTQPFKDVFFAGSLESMLIAIETSEKIAAFDYIENNGIFSFVHTYILLGLYNTLFVFSERFPRSKFFWICSK